MNIPQQAKNLIWITPAIAALLIALIPTLNSQWPLTWDIYYHIHIAQVYSQYGLTLTDPLIDLGKGEKIGYPPLFSLLLSFLVSALNIDYFQVARLLQPLLAFLSVLSVSFVAKKFYGNVAGVSAGFLMISSYLFGRLVSPLPETMALIFVPLAVYFYYKSVKDKKYLYALVSGLFFILVVLTHQATTLILFLVISSIAIFLCISNRNIRFFKNYIVFIFLPVITVVLVVIALYSMAPDFIIGIFNNGLADSTGIFTSLKTNEDISYFKYIAYIGILLTFAIIGAIVSIKRRNNKDLLILIWILVIFIISKAYWFGINVFSIRLLVHMLLPFSILGGLGLSYLYHDYKKAEFQSKKIRTIFLVTTLVIASLFAITTVEDPKFTIIPKHVNSHQIAPPTEYDIDLAEWFTKNEDKNYVIISNNYYNSIFLTSKTEKVITVEMNKRKKFTKEGYNVFFVLDKKLTTFNLYFKLLPPQSQLVYENKEYYIFEMKR